MPRPSIDAAALHPFPAPGKQLRDILEFFESKRRVALSEVDEVFREAQETQLTDTMYNQSDVESLLESIADSTKLRVEEALKRTEHMNALLLKMAITDAAERGVALDVDPRRAEDASLLAEVEQFRQGRLDMAKRVSRTVKLESLGEDTKRLREELDAAREENETLKRRYQQMQRQATEKSAEAARLRESAGEAKAPEPAPGHTEEEVAALWERLEEAEAELDKSVMQSKQFQQLKRILERKNTQLQVLREQLAKYEPDAAADE